MTPFPLSDGLGVWTGYLLYLMIGVSFGAVLEMAGFANSPKLAAQFYLKDMTVLKVMFTGVITAMVLIFLSTGMEVLDFEKVWVNPTYLWPGIVGGLIMGFGFIIGGFCPGTSLVALATLKIDGIFFTLGALTGIFFFGETVANFEGFWNSSYMGRYTLPEWLGLDTGVVVLLVVLMALIMFWGGEKLEKIFGEKNAAKTPKLQIAGAGALVAAAVGLIAIGQPTLEDRWEWIADQKLPLLEERQVQIHPGELADLMKNDRINLVMLDLRDEADFNLFHLKDVKSVKTEQLASLAKAFKNEPGNTVFVLMSNDEQRATEGWKILAVKGIPNIYLLEGGINNWLNVYEHDGHEKCPPNVATADDALQHVFAAAIGDRYLSAEAETGSHESHVEFTAKVKLETKRKSKQGGCG